MRKIYAHAYSFTHLVAHTYMYVREVRAHA